MKKLLCKNLIQDQKYDFFLNLTKFLLFQIRRNYQATSETV